MMESNLAKRLQALAIVLIAIMIPAGRALGIHWAVAVIIATFIGAAALTAAEMGEKPNAKVRCLAWQVAWNNAYSGIVALMLTAALY